MEYRWLPPDQIGELVRVEGLASGFHASEDYVRKEVPFYQADRALGAYDKVILAGTAAAIGREMSVPGGSLDMAEIAAVMVLPTHRRLGIMTTLIDKQLRDIHERSESVAALWTSDTRIYGRFGFGLAATYEDWTIERHNTGLVDPRQPAGRMRLVERLAAPETFAGVHDRMWRWRPGMMNRDSGTWSYRLADIEEERHGASAFFHAVYEVNRCPEGYVLYRVHAGNQELRVDELLGATGEATAALWSYCFGVDLIERFRAVNRPPDDPLTWMLANPRGLERRPHDGIWLRLVDVRAALGGRCYTVEGTVVLNVVDAFCPWNEGRYQLIGGPDGGECRATTADPEITLSAADLAAVYLGGVRLETLHRAGRVVVHDQRALRLADLMFSWHLQPWCPDYF